MITIKDLEFSAKYCQQSTAPKWFEELENEGEAITISVTSGSSPFNEWYAFKDRAQAVDFISDCFRSQSFTDGFELAQGEIYDSEELHALLSEQFGDDHDFSEVIDDADLSSLDPADLRAACEAESRF